MDYEAYNAYLVETGDSVIAWADPEGRFSGYTKVWILCHFLLFQKYPSSELTFPLFFYLFRDGGSRIFPVLSTLHWPTFFSSSSGLRS